MDHAISRRFQLKTVKIGIPNGIFFIGDPSARDFPDVDGIGGVWSTREIIAVACLHEQEGQAEITMGLAEELKPVGSLLFEGNIETSRRQVEVTLVPQHPTRQENPILAQSVPSERTRVRIWTNDPRWPDELFIALH
jgi:hypothetical protein